MVDANGQVIASENYSDWISYAPLMLDVPLGCLNRQAIGDWIHQTFQQNDGALVWDDHKYSNRKSPGYSFQAALAWLDVAQNSYVNAAMNWAENSGLWMTSPDTNGIEGGWVDWIDPDGQANWYERFIDTSTYYIMVQNGGFDFAGNQQARQLISHYYRSILGREPDPAGQDYWKGEVDRATGLGADIKEVFRVIADKFFNSPEYQNSSKTVDQFVADLYRTFFNRAPDPGGFAYWKEQLLCLPRDVVMYHFLFSPEFNEYMRGLFGAASVRAEIDMVCDFYRGLLGRLPDDNGFCYWLGQFRLAQCRGAEAVRTAADAISKLFIESREYEERLRNREQYIQDLYYAFLRRGADLGGFCHWLCRLHDQFGTELGGGRNCCYCLTVWDPWTSDQVRQAFVAAAEFQERVGNVIEGGCYPD